MFIDLNENLERIHSKRLALRPVSLADAWPLQASTKNPSFNQHLAWEAPGDLDALVERIQAIMSASRQGRLSAVSAVTKASGAFVSLFRFLPWKDDLNAIELGVWTHADYWHGRYSLELGFMCVDAAFSLTRATKVVGLSLPENKSSCRLMEAVGMRPAGRTVRYAENGKRLDVVQHELSRSDWESVASEVRYAALNTDGPIAEHLERGYAMTDVAPEHRTQSEEEASVGQDEHVLEEPAVQLG